MPVGHGCSRPCRLFWVNISFYNLLFCHCLYNSVIKNLTSLKKSKHFTSYLNWIRFFILSFIQFYSIINCKDVCLFWGFGVFKNLKLKSLNYKSKDLYYFGWEAFSFLSIGVIWVLCWLCFGSGWATQGKSETCPEAALVLCCLYVFVHRHVRRWSQSLVACIL